MRRAILKRTKTRGRNVKLDLRNKKLAINQADERDESWCDRCESESASDDAYGIDVLVHRTQVTLDTLTLKSGVHLKVLAGVDYYRFKKFVVSIVIRAHLAGGRVNGEPLLDDDQYRRLVQEYVGKTDDVGITASFLVEHDPVSNMVTFPVHSKAKDGISFQIFNYLFLLYFARTRREVEVRSMKHNGKLYMREVTREQTGGYQNLDQQYRELMEDPGNQRVSDKIVSKYPAD